MRSKTVGEEKKNNQSHQELKQEGAGGSNKQLVQFIRVTKHSVTRKSLKEGLIFWSKEQTDDYKFSQYLE
mgnify:CR=1 FL=1